MNEKISWKESFLIIHRVWNYSGNLRVFCILAAIGSSCAPLFYSFVNSYLYQLFVRLCVDTDKDNIIHSMKILLIVLCLVIVLVAVCLLTIFEINVTVRGRAKKKAYSHAMKLQESVLSTSYVGDLLARITKDFDNAFELMGYALIGYDNPFSMMITVFGTYIIILRNSILLANLSLLLTVINLIVVNYYIPPLQRKEEKVRKAASVAGEAIVNTLSGLMESRIFGFQDLLRERYTGQVNDMYKSSISIARKKANIQLLASIQGVFSSMGIILIGLLLSKKGSLDLPTLMFIANLHLNMSNTMGRFGERIASVQRNLVSGKRFLEFMDAKEEVERENKETPDRKALHAVEFSHVGFRYQEDQPNILNDLSLDINNGESLAIVGSSGGGKTTLLKLLLNFETIGQGTLKVMGHNIEDYSIETLRSLFSYVPQDCYLFDGTIKDNILLGKPDATEEELKKAIRQSYLEDFINSLKDGYNTEIGESGSKLSGGQRQRIAIARAMLKDAPIILLDEATSSLDSNSEQMVRDALIKLAENKTCITIAHRLSTIKESDRIIVLEKGSIVESGNHDSLMELNDRYAKLYQMQFV